jgi:ParB-like chromosome segregation protein Spo0J
MTEKTTPTPSAKAKTAKTAAPQKLAKAKVATAAAKKPVASREIQDMGDGIVAVWPKNAKEKVNKSLNDLEMSGVAAGPTMTAVGGKRTDMYSVPIDSLHIKTDFNVRTYDKQYHEHLENLATSIATNGFLKDRPLTVFCAREGDISKVYVIDGHSRLLAARMVNGRGDGEINELPVVVKPGSASQIELLKTLHISNSGNPLSTFEFGKLLHRLVARHTYTNKELGEMFGCTPDHARKALVLAGLPMVVQDMVTSNKMNANVALKIKENIKDAREQIAAAQDGLASATMRGSPTVQYKDIPKLARLSPSHRSLSALAFLANKTHRPDATYSYDDLVEAVAISLGKSPIDIHKDVIEMSVVDNVLDKQALKKLNEKAETSKQLPLEHMAEA